MNFSFQDSWGQEIYFDISSKEKKTLLGSRKVHYLLKITVGDSWAEFSASEFSESHVGMGEIVESVASSDGPVFVANVDWAPASSLFEQQVVGVPAGWWVLCFMDVEVDPVRAVFSPDRFGELLRVLVGMSDKGL